MSIGHPASHDCPCGYCQNPENAFRYCLSFLIATRCRLMKYDDLGLPKDIADIRNNFALLERAVAQFDTRFTLRALRSISSLRKRLTDQVLSEAIILTYPANNPTAKVLIDATGMGGGLVSKIVAQHADQGISKQNGKEVIPEIDVYIAILIQVRMFPP